MKIRIAYLTVVLATLLSADFVAAQKMERPKDREPGDRAVFNYTVNGKTQTLEENWIALTDEDMVGIHKVGGKDYEIAMTRSSYQMRKALCFPNGQQMCAYAPPLNIVDFPLEKGKKWTNTFTVTGESFTAEVVEERAVDRFEAVKVPAGEFETCKITSSGRIKSRDGKGGVYTGREESSFWVALISGKMITVKVAYKNSFGEKFALELISASFK